MDVGIRSGLYYTGWCLGLGLAYFLAGKLMLSISATNVALFWPSAGIALCALLFKGWRLWPGVLLGSLVSNVDNGVAFFCALGIAFGASLAALAGWYLLIRLQQFSLKVENIQGFASFILYGCTIPPIISAVIGNVSLLSFGLIEGDVFLRSFLSWWFGDALGILTAGSLIIMILSPYVENEPKE